MLGLSHLRLLLSGGLKKKKIRSWPGKEGKKSTSGLRCTSLQLLWSEWCLGCRTHFHFSIFKGVIPATNSPLSETHSLPVHSEGPREDMVMPTRHSWLDQGCYISLLGMILRGGRKRNRKIANKLWWITFQNSMKSVVSLLIQEAPQTLRCCLVPRSCQTLLQPHEY